MPPLLLLTKSANKEDSCISVLSFPGLVSRPPTRKATEEDGILF